jgi:hypothetical protein
MGHTKIVILHKISPYQKSIFFALPVKLLVRRPAITSGVRTRRSSSRRSPATTRTTLRTSVEDFPSKFISKKSPKMSIGSEEMMTGK